MNILFLGLMYNIIEEKELIFQSKTGLGIASNILQMNTIKGLYYNDQNIEVLSAKPVGNFPYSNKKFFYNANEYCIDEQINVKELFTLNLPILKDTFRKFQLKKYLKNWYDENKDNRAIIIYDLNSAFIDLLPWINETFDDFFVFLFIPDLQGDFRNSSKENKIVRRLSNLKNRNLFKKISSVDGYILITNEMIEVIPNKDFIEINGMVSHDEKKEIVKKNEKSQNTIFLYSGQMNEQYDIKKMVSSFIKSSEKNIELWLCGHGDLKDWISSIDDPKIKYFGLVTKSEADKLGSQADVLINPRTNNGIYTRYSFPSKNLEYLKMGKPVICYKLDGIPDIFNDYFDYITKEDSYETKISKYSKMDKSELYKIGMINQSFVFNNFSEKVQTKKIIEFIRKVIDKNGKQ